MTGAQRRGCGVAVKAPIQRVGQEVLPTATRSALGAIPAKIKASMRERLTPLLVKYMM